MKITKAALADAKVLTALTLRSKSYWNYEEKQILDWKPDLTITQKYFEESEIFKLSMGKKLIAFYAYQIENQTDLKLDFLFVEPEFIGKGYGKILIGDVLKRAENLGIQKMLVDSDPNSEGFYYKHGFRVIGKLKTSIKNRFLPIMEFRLKP